MSGEIWDKKRADSLMESAQPERRGMKVRYLRGLFLQTFKKFLISLTILDKFALSPANFDMDFWASFPFITNKIAHS
jgi:hypothetical protein